MADDDEFGDEIDWSTIQLPSISASMAVPISATTENKVNNSATMTAVGSGSRSGPRHRHSTGSAPAATATPYHSSGYPPLNNGAIMSGGQNHSRMDMLGYDAMGVGAASNRVASVNNNNNADAALRKQIEDLQTQLQNKDDLIFELEATAATSHAESTHLTQQAESNASKRVHLVEEELRRMRMEAEKYRGSWIRQKKRVGELEQQQQRQNGDGGGGQSKLKNGGFGNHNANTFTQSNHHGGNHHGVHVPDRIFSNNGTTTTTAWGGGGPPIAQVELRKVTPIIGNEENDHKDHNRSPSTIKVEADGDAIMDESPTKVSGSKRKTRKIISNAEDVDNNIEVKSYLPQQLLVGGGGGMSNSSVATDSVRQRLARHLLNRDEMGCHSLSGNSYANSISYHMLIDPALSMAATMTDVRRNKSSTPTRQQQSNKEKENKALASSLQHDFSRAKRRAAMQQQQDSVTEEEIRRFVKSILFQMVEAPERIGAGMMLATDNLTISGLVHLLLVKFNSLLHCVENEDDGTTVLDGDGDQVMVQANDSNHNRNKDDRPPLDTRKNEYQTMVLALSNSPMSDEERQKSSLECCMTTYATVSWRAVLYLLHILHDILLLSGNARDDLRWWFYQSRQSVGSGRGPLDSSSPSTKMGQGTKGTDGDGGPHPRIEGLPPINSRRVRDDADRKEAMWAAGCRSSSREQSDGWDPITMSRPCNTFFELLVGLMKGNVFGQTQKSPMKEESSNFGFEQTLVQIKAIDLVLALMSDAPPYDNAEGSHGNRTPYLWKFWYDSLLPAYSSDPVVKGHPQGLSNASSSDVYPIGDILSAWEKSENNYKDRLLGSGRKHSTRLLRDAPNRGIQQSKQSPGKQGRASNRSSRGNNSTGEAPKGNSNKSKLSPIHDKMKQQEWVSSISVKIRILQLLSHFILCSSSMSKSMYQKNVNGEEQSSLAKRILAAVLDNTEETILPFFSSYASSDIHHTRQDGAESCLQLCFTCLQFLLILSRSNEGIRMLRVQMRLESEHDEPSCWSQSAVGCVTSVLNSTLSFAMEIEERENALLLKQFAQHAHTMNTIVDQCVIFFKTLLISVHRQRSSSSSSRKAATFLALISEHRTIFQSCCQSILAHNSPNSVADPPRLLHFSERLKYHVRYLFEEIVMDEEEENRERK